jgi:hypothetical protein
MKLTNEKFIHNNNKGVLYMKPQGARQVCGLLDTKMMELINPLNAELNSICHLLLLLKDLTFMGLCI